MLLDLWPLLQGGGSTAGPIFVLPPHARPDEGEPEVIRAGHRLTVTTSVAHRPVAALGGSAATEVFVDPAGSAALASGAVATAVRSAAPGVYRHQRVRTPLFYEDDVLAVLALYLME